MKTGTKVSIVCDYREREIINSLAGMGANVDTRMLNTGDFVCSDRIVIERKDHSDFVSSIIDGRLFRQLHDMKKNFEKAVVIIEGSSNRMMSENALKAAMARVVVDDGVSLITTKGIEDTAKTIFWIAKKEQEEEKRDVLFKNSKKSVSKSRIKQQIVAGLPGVSEVMSKRLLRHFKSVSGVFNASEEELMKVKGIGEMKAKALRKLIDS